MKKIFLLFLMFWLFSCEKERESGLPRLITDNTKNAIDVNSKQMLRSEPVILNVNFRNDTIIVKHISENAARIRAFPFDTILPKYDVKVFIDTTYDFYAKGFIYERLKWPVVDNKDWEKYKGESEMKIPSVKYYFNRLNFLRTKLVSAYPVLIFNHSVDTAYIEHGLAADVRIIQEALDIDGKWKPIEFQSSDVTSCTPMYMNYALSSKHYMAVGIIKYSGEFKTKIRVKLRTGEYTYYSNEINGTINRSQFNQGFLKEFLKERGRYDEEYFETGKEYFFLNR